LKKKLVHLNCDLLVPPNEKHLYTDEPLYINNDNVYLTDALFSFRLKNKVYSIDYTCTNSILDIVNSITNGDDVIIHVNEPWSIIIPHSLETKLKLAIEVEDYLLAAKINNKIKLVKNDKRK
jgi:hypothetical protein